MFVASAQKGPGSWFQEHFAGSRISKSTDGGKTWQAVRHGFPERLRTAFEAMCLEDWENRSHCWGQRSLVRCGAVTDGGEQWTEVISGLAPISKGNHYVAFATA